MNIKSEEAHRLAKELAQIEGRSMTQVVIDALRDRLRRQSAPARRAKAEKALQELRELLKGQPPLSTDDLYDPETGLPA